MANMSATSIVSVRRFLFAGSLFAMIWPGPTGAADLPDPVGTWIGVVVIAQRNIPATLTVGPLQLSKTNGSMVWGAPKRCTLITDYAGTSGNDYVLNVAATNGGWCDLYHNGALHMNFEADAPHVLLFQLTDASGHQPVAGKLAPAGKPAPAP